jgi:protein O-GlcNAc transferase
MASTDQLFEKAFDLQQAGRFHDAERLCRQILAANPQEGDALQLLGVLQVQQGKKQEGIELLRRALVFNPTAADCYLHLGVVLAETGRLDESISSLGHAIHLEPKLAAAHSNMARTLAKQGQWSQACAAFTEAAALEPNQPENFNNLGIALQTIGRLDEAIAAFDRAIQLQPDYAFAHNNRGNALLGQAKWEEAAEAYRQATRIQPRFAGFWSNLANPLSSMGEVQQAIDCLERAIDLDPDEPKFLDNLIIQRHFIDAPKSLVTEELQSWNKQFAVPLRENIPEHQNYADPERPLRIGYVSADFWNHASAYFLDPLLRSHDSAQVEIFCYSQVASPDAVTQRLKSHTHHWRNILGQSDEELAEQIQQDQIDLLIDLKLHTADNRLLMFARKPAPVQISWLGYPGSSGVETIEYRLTDSYLEPPGTPDFPGEQAIRLPDSFWCYDPLTDEPQVNDLPAKNNGFITFGCLNAFSKIGDEALDLWMQVLQSVPNSRLRLLAPAGTAQRRVAQRLGRFKIESARVEFVDRKSRPDYLREFHRIDICLDTFPCNGHTTSLDGLWMGVPLVTLVGKDVMGRAGWSHLSNLGLPELAAHSPEQFVQIASTLAADPSRLSQLRATLRERMKNSPLMDGHRFAKAVEAAYRHAWRQWCGRNSR